MKLKRCFLLKSKVKQTKNEQKKLDCMRKVLATNKNWKHEKGTGYKQKYFGRDKFLE